MNQNLLYVLLFGGMPVIASYYILSQQQEAKQLWAGLQGWVLTAWYTSMAVTVLSYFYLAYMFVWGVEDAYIFEWPASDMEAWLCAIYTVFLGSAAQYAFISILDAQQKRKSIYLTINLWLTAFASILIAASAMAINCVSDLHNYLSIAAGFILALHHIGFDAIYWLSSFDPKYTEIA